MKAINLRLDKRLTLDAVAHATAYIGQRHIGIKEGEPIFDKVFATDEDRMMLSRYWHEATARCTDLFKPFIASVSQHDLGARLDLNEDYEVRLELPSSFDEQLASSLGEQMHRYASEYISARWLSLLGHTDYQRKEAEAERIYTLMRSALYHRSKPKRKQV